MAAFGLGGFGDLRGGPGGIVGLGLGAPRGFEEQYHCYPVSFQVSSYVLLMLLYNVLRSQAMGPIMFVYYLKKKVLVERANFGVTGRQSRRRSWQFKRRSFRNRCEYT